MCECKLLLCGAFVLCNVIIVTSFNIDLFNYAIYKNTGASMFGFTVAVHKDSGNRGWVLVGAPESGSRYQNHRYKGGAVYKCRTDADDVCEEILFSRESYSDYRGKVLDDKSQQWFGATLTSSNHTDGRIVACAPRYVWFTKDLNRRDPVGTCFVVDSDFQNAEEYSPCRTMNWGYHRQGSCQAGFSAAINGIGDRLYVGAPGSYYWQGQLYSIDAHARFNFTPGLYGNTGFGAKGSVLQQSLENRPAVFSTREGRSLDDDSYMGYSMVVGDFQEQEEYEGIAVGMPRGNGLKGKVLLFSWDLKNYKNLTVSNQIGSYFGYSITAADVNGDRRMDIIVGAPMHTEPNNGNKYDVGRVYIFHQSRDFVGSFSNFSFIDGTTSKSRFGHAVSTLGDLNQDGYEDFAVGAPYGGPDGRGAVYIYYGSKTGINKKTEQVIYAKNIETNIPLQTFGFSISGGMDLDGNDYPDMAVGAYLSDTAFFFRSQPVVLVDAYVQFRTAEKQIDVKHKNCQIPGGLEAICTDIDFCMKYTGKGIPQQLYFNVEYILDSKKPNASRMGFFTRKTHQFVDTLLLFKNSQNCKSERIYIRGDLRDKLTPLEAEMKYSIMDESSSLEQIRDPRSHLKPALDLNSPPSRKDSIVVQKNCGRDDICIPDLHVKIDPNVKAYLAGSNGNLEFDVIVSNYGEDAFETTFEMKYPKGIHYRKIETSPDMPGILCSPSDTPLITCDIGNPLPGGKIAMFKIILQPPSKEATAPPSYEFDVFVNSTNPETNFTRENNYKHISIGVWINATLELRGESYPPTVYYNESHYTSDEIVQENSIGPQVTHVYYVRNEGPATIQEAEVFILWPLQTLGGNDLLYLLEPPHTIGNVQCDAGLANHESYRVNYYNEPIWGRLRIDTSHVEQTTSINRTSIKITETGNGVSSGIGVINTNETIESEVGSSGDSSTVIERRHNESTNVNSFGRMNSRGEYVITEAKYRTVYTNGVPHTTWHNVTTYRDADGNILRTSYSGDSTDESSSAQNVNFTQKAFGAGKQTGSGNFVNQGSSGTNWQTTNQEEMTRAEHQRRVQEQDNQERIRQNQEYERRQEEAWRASQLEERRQQQEAQRRQQEAALKRQQETQIRQQEEAQRRQQEEARRRQQEEAQRRQQEEESRRQQSGYGQGGIVYGENNQRQNVGWDQTSGGQVFRTEEERRRYFEQRRAQEASRQGGVQESGSQGQNERQFHGRISGGGREHVLTGYYDQNGVYHDYTGQPSGNVIYNRTYTIETTDTVPIDLPGGQGGQHLGFGETALGSGFTVQTLDLGNSASESSLAGANSENAGSSGGFREQLYEQDQASRKGGSASSGGGYNQDWHVEGSYSQRGQIPPTIVHNTVERDNVPTDRPNPNARSRGRRQVNPYDEIQTLVKCNATRCNYIRCVVGNLHKDEEVIIALRSRLNVREVNNLTSSQAIKISSMIVGKISKLNMRHQSGQVLLEKEVVTEVPAKEAELVPEVAPLWIYVISAVAGVVMLLLLIWILSKCGFFKRNRPSSAPERQPLNRNGYHSGDEAL